MTYTYDVISRSQSHATDTNSEAGGGKVICNTVTYTVNGGVEALFQEIITNPSPTAVTPQ
jgi:hypothetical protein